MSGECQYRRLVLKKAADGGIKISQVISEIADECWLTDDENAEMLPSGEQTVVADRAHCSKTYLKQAALVNVPLPRHARRAERRGEWGLPARAIRGIAIEQPHRSSLLMQSADDVLFRISRAHQRSSLPLGRTLAHVGGNSRWQVSRIRHLRSLSSSNHRFRCMPRPLYDTVRETHAPRLEAR